MSEQGYIYEKQVIESLKAAGICGNILNSAGADASRADADMNIRNQIFNVEVKLNNGAQMGGSSIRYCKTGEVELVSEMKGHVADLLTASVLDNRDNIKKLIEFLEIKEEKENGFRGFPLSCKKSTWQEAADAGLLINSKVPLSTEFICDHYAKKNIFYIQIGGAGLFHLEQNPAELPVPKLEGKIFIEIRTARSGSKKLKDGTKMVGAGIRAQGRLKTKSSSPFTLDCPNSIHQMLSVLECRKNIKNLGTVVL